MAISFDKAVGAYQNQMRLGNMPALESEQPTQGTAFSDMLSNAWQQATSSLQQAEALEQQSLSTGKVELADLVTAVTSAELTLNTMVAVRDRVISAYQDILRMPI